MIAPGAVYDVEDKRRQVARLLTERSPNIRESTINKLSAADLRLMFELYDILFFRGWFKDNYKGNMKFSLSERMTRSAGMTIYPKDSKKLRSEEVIVEIRIGVDFLFHFNILKGSRKVCGIEAVSSLQALQLVFEHELCHALELVIFGDTNCKGQRFKDMACTYFGHTKGHHELPSHREIASSKLGLNVGDTVEFNFEGRRLKGLLYKINKRAVIMVRDSGGQLVDKEGRRYVKYYVPLQMLEKLCES